MTALPPHFRTVGKELHIEDVPLSRIADKLGTPVYVYSQAALLEPLKRIQKGLAGLNHLVCFAVKANSNLSVLGQFAKAGAGFDVVSGGELFRAKMAGAKPSRLVFSGVGKTEQEMRDALSWGKEGILAFNVESAEELETLNNVAGTLKRKARVSFRLNPDVDPKTHPYISTGLKKNKFGVPRKEAFLLAKRTRDLPWIHFVGASVHIGSQLVSLRPLRDAFLNLADFSEQVARDLDLPFEHLDLGGGLGIRYINESPPSIEEYCHLIKSTFGPRSLLTRKTGLRPKLLLEPGRLLAGNAGTLLTKTLYRKKGVSRNFLIVDAAMNDLVRPALYGSHHRIVPTQSSPSPDVRFDVVGPVCETSDVFERGATLPGSIAAGDYLAILSAGAYGFSMASQYNSRVRPPEVLVNGNRFKVIRARESYEDLIRHEK